MNPACNSFEKECPIPRVPPRNSRRRRRASDGRLAPRSPFRDWLRRGRRTGAEIKVMAGDAARDVVTGGGIVIGFVGSAARTHRHRLGVFARTDDILPFLRAGAVFEPIL